MTMKADWPDFSDMLPRGARVLCAVSGGADSMFLLHRLARMREARELALHAAHFNHMLRGEESDRDARFTLAQCEALGVPCALGQGNVAEFAAERSLGLEDAARRLRYRFLEETADALGCDRIATAHTADDNAETLLMNLCRGAGARGLGGIPPVRGRFIRPLLRTERSEIEAWLRENNIPWVEDSSNRFDDYTRNRFRHRVLPLLKEENPSFLSAAGRTAELLREDDACLCRMADAFLRENLRVRETGERSLSSGALLALEPAVSTRVLRSLCGRGLSMERARALLRFAGGAGPGVLELPGQRVLRSRGRLIFPPEALQEPANRP